MNAIYKGTCAKEDDHGGEGDEGIDGHPLLRGPPDQAAKGARAAVGAAVNVTLTHYRQVFKYEQAQKRNLDADLQE